MAGIVYPCDPDKNTECSKKNCFKNGGTCFMTRNINFAKQPLKTATIVMGATKQDLELFVGIDFEDTEENKKDDLNE